MTVKGNEVETNLTMHSATVSGTRIEALGSLLTNPPRCLALDPTAFGCTYLYRYRSEARVPRVKNSRRHNIAERNIPLSSHHDAS